MTGQVSASSSAFNLIELVVAVACLLIIVTMVGIIFKQSQATSKQELDNARVMLAGRNAIKMVANDLQSAVADSHLAFYLDFERAGVITYGYTNSEVCFISLQNSSSDSNRTAREVFYWLREMTNAPSRYELIRSYRSSSATLDTNSPDNCYWSTNWFANRPTVGGIAAENIAAFSIMAVDTNWNSSDLWVSNQLPMCVDVCLELLPDRAAKQASDMRSRDLDCSTLVEQNARRFTTRVYFQNRIGYMER